MAENEHGRTPSDLIAGLPKWIIAVALLTIAAAFAWIVYDQPTRFEFAGLGFGVDRDKDDGPERAVVPAGAVVAFDRPNGCPEGWSDMGPSWSGSTLVAAVRDANNRFGFRRTGGSMEHKLTVEEMPAHSHEFFGRRVATYSGTQSAETADRVGVGGPNLYGQYTPEGRVALSGGGQPHNNMPPFIALYFCKKESR